MSKGIVSADALRILAGEAGESVVPKTLSAQVDVVMSIMTEERFDHLARLSDEVSARYIETSMSFEEAYKAVAAAVLAAALDELKAEDV